MNSRRGVSALELMLGFGLVVLVVVLFIYQTGLVHLVLVRSSAKGVVRSFGDVKGEATDGRVQVVFRPRGGPYRSYYTRQGGDRNLQRGVYLVNSSGLIDEDDALYVDVEGKLFREPVEGEPLTGFFTVASTQSRGIAEVKVDPEGLTMVR